MKKTAITLAFFTALTLFLSGCGKLPADRPAATAEIPAPAQSIAPAASPESESAPARRDGERFESVIWLEGMEETVQYEHIRNEALGFAMDYDYETFRRHTDEDSERFVSVWDDLLRPENYLELRSDTRDAEEVSDAVSAELSGEFDLIRSERDLERAGRCIRIEASVIKGTNQMAQQLQAVYIIPAPDGCRVATAHCFAAESEGFFRRFEYMLHTLEVLTPA